MGGYEVDSLLFSKKFFKSQDSLVKDIAGRCSLYLYSQLPFVEILCLPAFFELHIQSVFLNVLKVMSKKRN